MFNGVPVEIISGTVVSLLLALLGFLLSWWHHSVESRLGQAEQRWEGTSKRIDGIDKRVVKVETLMESVHDLREDVRDLKTSTERLRVASERFHRYVFTAMKAPKDVGPYTTEEG